MDVETEPSEVSNSWLWEEVGPTVNPRKSLVPANLYFNLLKCARVPLVLFEMLGLACFCRLAIYTTTAVAIFVIYFGILLYVF